jgi:hypothetical protein
MATYRVATALHRVTSCALWSFSQTQSAKQIYRQTAQHNSVISMSRTMATALAMLVLGASAFANTVQYQYCVTGDHGQGNILVNAGPVNFGKEWYKTKATQNFCMATGSHACTGVDYDSKVCGSLPQQTYNFTYLNGDQLTSLGSLFSGNPVPSGQTLVELAVNTPGAAVVAVGNVGAKVGTAAGTATATAVVGVAHGTATAGKAVASGTTTAAKTVGRKVGGVFHHHH